MLQLQHLGLLCYVVIVMIERCNKPEQNYEFEADHCVPIPVPDNRV